jgi:hypothetical protein
MTGVRTTSRFPQEFVTANGHLSYPPDADAGTGMEHDREHAQATSCRRHSAACVPGYSGNPTNVGWPAPGIVKDSLAVWRKVTREQRVELLIHAPLPKLSTAPVESREA